MKGADLDEIEALYRARFHAFVRTAAAVAGDVDSGLEAVQEGFATAVRKRSTYRGEGSLEAWVWPIVLNEARDRLRRRTPAVPGASEPTDEREATDAEALRLALAALPERQRLVAFLRYYADLDYDGIASVLGIAPGTVAATLNAAHAALRERLEGVRS
jgi:RNA polymerase sigma-70 factor, ECF subfamily